MIGAGLSAPATFTSASEYVPMSSAYGLPLLAFHCQIIPNFSSRSSRRNSSVSFKKLVAVAAAAELDAVLVEVGERHLLRRNGVAATNAVDVGGRRQPVQPVSD